MGLNESESERDGRENGRDAGMLKVVVCSAAAQSGIGEVSTGPCVLHASDDGKCGFGVMHDGYGRLTGAVALRVGSRALGCERGEDQGDGHSTHGQSSRWLDLEEMGRTSTAEPLHRMSWQASVCYIYEGASRVLGRAPIPVGACAYAAMSFSRILKTYIMRHFAGSTAACKLPNRGRSEWRKLLGHRC